MKQVKLLTVFVLRFGLWPLIAFCKMTIGHIAVDHNEPVAGAICLIWPTGMVSFRWGTEVNRFPIFVLGEQQRIKSQTSTASSILCRGRGHHIFVGSLS